MRPAASVAIRVGATKGWASGPRGTATGAEPAPALRTAPHIARRHATAARFCQREKGVFMMEISKVSLG